ncbi:hypothetical protein V5P93_003769 [Actinokineospora auranticolor]|uniref:Uncharacterized protein n=1 Tax=Actinokineospora auranticolor TaxID=155976 RepID=A0A2S6GLL6_9PSEU|nr:hypothetical protein [Actinokineospora auranticolor]PPK66056.1 hypothetical protein CLV40_11120 [Actinokineospora auranticolor]
MAAVLDFAEDAGESWVQVFRPSVDSGCSLDDLVAHPLLARLFGPDLRGLRDGARVSLPAAAELVRLMLRGEGLHCFLRTPDVFTVDVGKGQDMQVSSAEECVRAVASARAAGPFPQRWWYTPYWPSCCSRVRPADEGFWSEVAELAAGRGTVLVEERFADDLTRWLRVRTAEDVAAVAAGMVERSLVGVWPDPVVGRPSEDEDSAGVQARLGSVPVLVRGPLPGVDYDQRLAVAAVPDADGVVRSPWKP